MEFAFLQANVNEMLMWTRDTDTCIFVVEPTNGTFNAQVTTYDCSSSPFSLDFFLQSFYHVSRSGFCFSFRYPMLAENMTHLCNNNWMGVCDGMKMSAPKTRAKVKPQWSKQVNKWCEHKKPVVFDDRKKLQSSVKRSAVCALFHAFALEALNSSSWIMVCVCVCVLSGQHVLFSRPPFDVRAHSIFFANHFLLQHTIGVHGARSVLVNLLLLLLASWSLSIYPSIF